MRSPNTHNPVNLKSGGKFGTFAIIMQYMDVEKTKNVYVLIFLFKRLWLFDKIKSVFASFCSRRKVILIRVNTDDLLHQPKLEQKKIIVIFKLNSITFRRVLILRPFWITWIRAVCEQTPQF